ncbi:hypothetical protein MCOR25_002387 [Pyricularia grisea]|nr:hypothetical protein MCOR25_002387 [Pyricularia grisea]
MDKLLNHAFDNLASYDGAKVRRGLRQVEGLLAPICLAPPVTKESDVFSTKPAANQSSGSPDQPAPRRTLAELAEDPAFRAFFRLQDSFEWNIISRLIDTLNNLLSRGAEGENDMLIVSALELMQGLLLLHPPSKILFMRDPSMNLLLDLLEPCNCPAIQKAAVLVLVTALIDTPQNTRTFERLDGLLTVTSLFKSRATSRDLKVKLMEFLYFYLMPETASIPRAELRERPSVPALLQRSPSKLAKAFSGDGTPERRSRADSGSGTILSTEEKQALLARHLSNVGDLVRDLRSCTPFGVIC